MELCLAVVTSMAPEKKMFGLFVVAEGDRCARQGVGVTMATFFWG